MKYLNKLTLVLLWSFVAPAYAKDVTITASSGKTYTYSDTWSFENADSYLCKFEPYKGVFVTYLVDEDKIRIDPITDGMSIIIKIDRSNQKASIKQILGDHVYPYTSKYYIDDTGLNFILETDKLEALTLFHNLDVSLNADRIPAPKYYAAYSNHNNIASVPGAMQRYGYCTVQNE